MATRPKATIKDLYHLPEDGKAEIVNGELISRTPTGFLPGRTAGTLYLSLREYEPLRPVSPSRQHRLQNRATSSRIVQP